MKKILLADDSVTIQKVVELTFSEEDYQVSCVSNGSQALRKIAEWRPDIVLLDVIMPEKSGYEVCEEIKRNPSTASIPVLLLTGTFEPFDQKRAEAARADGHLTKPFESQALISRVDELIAATPPVADADASGMDVVAGGDLYHVAPPGTAPTMSDARTPTGGAGLQEPPVAFPASTAAPESQEHEVATSPHPPLQEPDASSGGSYVGFADLDVETAEPEIVPDRFDESSAETTTVRLDRSDLIDGSEDEQRGAPPPSSEGESSRFSSEAIEGLTGAFETPEPRIEEGPATTASPDQEDPIDWASPPEAPPAPTWEPPEEVPLAAPPAASSDNQGHGPMSLTPEAIDLIAERVVQRISDRVVREIAWEVVPHMAEAVVRRRIKELEESEGD